VAYAKKIVGFLVYFFLAAGILSLFLRSIFIPKPLFEHSANVVGYLRNNSGLVLVCIVAAALHLFGHSFLIGISAYSLWIYNFLNHYWHRLFSFPIQYLVWASLIILFFIYKQNKVVNFIRGCSHSASSLYHSSYIFKISSIVVISGIFVLYTKLIPSYSFWDHLYITGEPPLGTMLSLIVYLLFGAANKLIAPVIVQFSFYLLSGVFLYMTISLFCEKETALLGSAIYLLSPIIFTYATLGHLQSGVVFFIIIVSYLFLKFMRDGDTKDLILTAYFISIGSLYKREIILMLVICIAYMMVNKIKQKNLNYLKVLSLPLLSFLPWYFIGTRGADKMVLDHVSSFNKVSSALLMIPSQLSVPIFLLFLLSVVFILLIRRETLFLFFFFVFISYYFLYSALEQQTVHRYSMAFYPTIAVFIAQSIRSMSNVIKWKHFFKSASLFLIIYLAVLCIIPRSSTQLITFKYSDFENQSFPFDESLEWILNNVAHNENVIALMIPGDLELRGMRQNKVPIVRLGTLLSLWTTDEEQLLRKVLKDLCKKLNASYIMFPVTDAEITHPFSKEKAKKIMRFLEEDKYNDFILTAKFNADDNYIYIYKVKQY
jgi:hypothetical protein